MRIPHRPCRVVTDFLWEKSVPPPTIAEQAVEINAVFETPKPYTTRRLDSTDVLAFLERNPQFQRDSAELRDFYRSRGQQYAWFVNDSLSTAADAMVNLLDPTGQGEQAEPWKKLIAEGRADSPLNDSIRLQVELGLTAQFFRAAEKQDGGYVQGDLRELGWYIPRRRIYHALDSPQAGRPPRR